MYKRLVSMLLMLMLLFTLPQTLAEAPSLTITGITENGNGTVTVTWDDPTRNGPYELGWVASTTENYLLDLALHDAWRLPERQTGSSGTLGALLPDTNYWIYVKDAAGNGAHMRCERPEAQPFSGPGMTIVMKPRKQNSGGLSAFKTWSASAIESASADTEYGVRLEVTHGYMAQEQVYYLQLVMTDPNGGREMVTACDFTTGGKYGSKTTFINFYSFDQYFDRLVLAHSEVPRGTYTLSVYLDGGHITDVPFEMGE